MEKAISFIISCMVTHNNSSSGLWIAALGHEDKALWEPLTIALVASMTQAFGISLQRRSHLLRQELQDVEWPLYKRPMWLSGFLIYTLSNIIASTCTIGYLPIVILAPVGAIGLVFNAIFAKLVLGDPFTIRTILGKSSLRAYAAIKQIFFADVFMCI